jgi:hypothetical protein
MPDRVKEKLVELIRKAKAAMKKENPSCDLEREYFIAESLIANGVTVQEWIPVKERLPEDWKERVLVKINDANNIIGHPDMDTDRYMGEIWVRWGHNVTHWMPLPPPPKGDG